MVDEQGKLILQRYASDKGITADTPLQGFSVCKSVANAFLGLRVADRAIRLTDLVQAPGWSKAEVLRRNLTSALSRCLLPSSLPSSIESLPLL